MDMVVEERVVGVLAVAAGTQATLMVTQVADWGAVEREAMERVVVCRALAVDEKGSAGRGQEGEGEATEVMAMAVEVVCLGWEEGQKVAVAVSRELAEIEVAEEKELVAEGRARMAIVEGSQAGTAAVSGAAAGTQAAAMGVVSMVLEAEVLGRVKVVMV